MISDYTLIRPLNYLLAEHDGWKLQLNSDRSHTKDMALLFKRHLESAGCCRYFNQKLCRRAG